MRFFPPVIFGTDYQPWNIGNVHLSQKDFHVRQETIPVFSSGSLTVKLLEHTTFQSGAQNTYHYSYLEQHVLTGKWQNKK